MAEQQPDEEENAAELKLGSGACCLCTCACWPGASADQALSHLLGAVFNTATALSNSEAATLMNIVLEVRKQADPAYTPNPVMQKTLEYAGAA